MLIDDSSIDNWIVERLIKEINLSQRVLTHTCAMSALEYFRNIEKLPKEKTAKLFPDVILLDINMQMMDGFDFLSQFENLHSLCAPKIYMLSASINPEDHKKAEKFNSVKGFITKPLERKHLLEIMNSTL